jgi:hypothetical protein
MLSLAVSDAFQLDYQSKLEPRDMAKDEPRTPSTVCYPCTSERNHASFVDGVLQVLGEDLGHARGAAERTVLVLLRLRSTPPC